MPDTNPDKPVVVLGATGYIGGRLTPMLLDAGYRVRAAARSARKLQCRPWGNHPGLEIVPADVFDKQSLVQAFQGCSAAYYLVHSMSSKSKDFSRSDRAAAENTAQAAQEAGLERIIYLGGLGDEDADLSEHLRSRIETGKILESGAVPLTWLRAAVILGSGSASFEILRYLAEHLPVMITPRWVDTVSQPIAVSNVLYYLLKCLEIPETKGRSFGICGPDTISYRKLFRLYALEAGLGPRIIIPVPFFTPKLSSYWIHLVTPVPGSIARPLADGLRNTVVCRENTIRELIPQELLTCREAIRTALEKVKQQQTETCWSDAGRINPPEWLACGDAPYAGGTVLECSYKVVLKSDPEPLRRIIHSVGGETGWYFGDKLWSLRGFMDRLTGGPGTRRGRRSNENVRTGDALDFWRVLASEEDRLLLLAEMKMPGQAVLQLDVNSLSEDKSEMRLIARFLPRGLAGLLYWKSLMPLHRILFRGMLKNMARAAKAPILEKPTRFSDSGHTCRLPE